jgi:type IV secretion system protein VirB9
MNTRSFSTAALAGLSFVLAACASTPKKPVVALEAPQLEIMEPVVAPATPVSSTRKSSGKAMSPLQALEAANNIARQRPAADGFSAARQVYNYRAGALFELYANPNYVSTILLEAGETLTNIAAGDTSRWMVTQAEAETQSAPRTIVLVKPHASGLRTNIVLITDRRTYLIEAIAQSGNAYAAQVAWSYNKPIAASVSAKSGYKTLAAMNEAYRIRTIKGRAPVWLPTRVFDDGRRTWIEFSDNAEAADLPPVFVITGEGVELVNYRIQHLASGQRYMIDRVFDRAELRLGAKAPVIVRIDRQAPKAGART